MPSRFQTTSLPDADAATDEPGPRWRDFIETMKRLGVSETLWSAHIDEMKKIRANAVGRQVKHKVKNLIEPITQTGNGLPIYFVHSVLGTGIEVLDLADMLAPGYRIFSIRPSTEYHNGKFPSSVEDMAVKYVDELRMSQPPGPIVLIGRSAGVIPALHMRERLIDFGYQVKLFVALDFAPYGTGADIGPFNIRYNYQRVLHWIRQLHSEWENRSSYASFIMSISKNISNMLCQFWHQQEIVFDSTERELEIPPYFTKEERDFVVKFNSVMKAYRYRPSVMSKEELRVLAFTSTKEPDRSLYNVEQKWRRLISPEYLEIVSLSGTHRDIAERPNVLLVANHLRARLKELS